MNNEVKEQQLKEYAEVLKQNGFDVYMPVKSATYCHFVKDDKIGYVEASDWGFNFSSVHKPCRECGTGFSIHREVFTPTVQMAIDCFVIAPNWGINYCKVVNKYKSWEDYLKYPTNKILQYAAF